MKASKLLNPVSMLAAGLFLGVMTRLFDIYCQNLGEVFSPMGSMDDRLSLAGQCSSCFLRSWRTLHG